MSGWASECEEVVSHSKIKFDDRTHGCKKSLTLFNPERESIKKVDVDHCAMENETSCDWLATASDFSLLIEFKGGSHHDDGLEQLTKTIDRFGQNLSGKRTAYLIGHSMPRSVDQITLKKKFKSRGVSLILKSVTNNNTLELAISQLK